MGRRLGKHKSSPTYETHFRCSIHKWIPHRAIVMSPRGGPYCLACFLERQELKYIRSSPRNTSRWKSDEIRYDAKRAQDLAMRRAPIVPAFTSKYPSDDSIQVDMLQLEALITV